MNAVEEYQNSLKLGHRGLVVPLENVKNLWKQVQCKNR